MFLMQSWEQDLLKYGFSPDPDVPDGFSRKAGAFGFLIKKSCPLVSKEAFLIELDVLHRFDDEDAEQVVLSAILRRKERPVPFDFGGGDLWKPPESALALAALIKYGIPWFQEYGCAEKLIDYFELCLREGIPKTDWDLPVPFKKIATRQGVDTDSNVRRPPAYHEYLAYLYRDVGNLDLSRQHAQRYLSLIPNNPHWTAMREKMQRLIESTHENS